MGHVLSLTDGTTTISLTSSGVMLRHYALRTPDIDPTGLIGSVGEVIEILIEGANESAVTSKVRAIDDMLGRARARYWTGSGPRVFLQRALTGAGTTYRSELINGSLDPDDDALQIYTQYKIGYRLVLTRVGYWEGPRAQIALSNTHGTSNTSGLTVYAKGNGASNYTDIAAASVTGSLPAPLELQMTNTSGGTREYRNFRIANNTFDTSLSHIIEAETVPAVADFADSGSSGGTYAGFTGLGVSYDFTIDNSRSAKIAGRRVHILARFAVLPITGSPSVWAQCMVMDSVGITPLYTAPEVKLTADDFIQTLGTVPLPPTNYDTSGPTLVLRVNIVCASSTTVGLDYIQLTPADDLCYRHLIQRGYGVANGATIVDNGIEGLAYLSVSNINYPLYTARTQPVHVFPNRNQRLYFLHDGENSSINWTLSVKAYYRPRVLSL